MGLASFTERYHELTKYHPDTIDKLGSVHWENQPPPFKNIHAERKIDLSPYLKSLRDTLKEEEPRPDWGQWIEEGRLDAIAPLLFFTMGITARLATQAGTDFFLRAAPSAGGLYPTELYVAVRRSRDLPDGIYHYHSLRSCLVPVWQGDFWADLDHYFLNQPSVRSSNCIALFTGMYGRSAWRYKERAYRRILLDTGHALGNMLEVCESSRIRFALLGGFLDSGLEELFFLTAKEEFPLMGVALGAHLPAGSPVQFASDPPNEAVKHTSPGDPMQVQQNNCERIFSDKTRLLPEGQISGLPDFKATGYNPLRTIVQRRSCRQFSGEAVDPLILREVLSHSFRAMPDPWRLAPDRLEFHLIVLNVEGMEQGVYHYIPQTGEMAPQRLGDFREEALQICLGQELASDSACLLVYSSDLDGLTQVYGDRGYRYIGLEAGQIGERINLWAVHSGLGSSGIGGYYDDKVNELLDLPLSMGVMYITLLGKPQ